MTCEWPWPSRSNYIFVLEKYVVYEHSLLQYSSSDVFDFKIKEVKHGSGSCCILQNKTKEKYILLFLDLNLSEILTSSLNNNISDT
jgi:hypothetical protein